MIAAVILALALLIGGSLYAYDEGLDSARAVVGLSPCTANGGYESVAVTGSGWQVVGGIHSNGDVELLGTTINPGEVDGGAAAVDTVDYDPANVTFTNPSAPTSGVAVYNPVTLWEISEFQAPTGPIYQVANSHGQYYSATGSVDEWGDFSGSGHPKAGVYYVDGSITFNSSDLNGTALNGVTLVATGAINLDFGSAGNILVPWLIPTGEEVSAGVTTLPAVFTPYGAGTCDGSTHNEIEIAGHVSMLGVIYAPFGEISITMPYDDSIQGSIFGYRVNVSGSDFTITYDPDWLPYRSSIIETATAQAVGTEQANQTATANTGVTSTANAQQTAWANQTETATANSSPGLVLTQTAEFLTFQAQLNAGTVTAQVMTATAAAGATGTAQANSTANATITNYPWTQTAIAAHTATHVAGLTATSGPQATWAAQTATAQYLMTQGISSPTPVPTASLGTPGTPALLSPANGAWVTTTTPTLTWAAAYNSPTYRIQIDTTSDFANPQEVNTVVSVTSFTPGTLSQGTHFWRVRGINTNGQLGSWSSVRSFKVDTVAPGVPVLSSPAANATLAAATPTLLVKSVSGSNRYQFQVSTLADFSNIVVDKTVTTTSTTATPALTFGMYYWRARALDAANNMSGWSAVRALTYTLMSAPANGSFTTDTTPAFSWKSMSGATGWHLMVDNNANFSSPEVNQTINSGGVLTYSPPSALPFGLYYWKLQVNSASGWSIWMPTRTLTVSPAYPAAPALTAPANGFKTNDTTPAFTWNSVASADHYQIQISTNSGFTALVQDVTLGTSVLTYTPPALTDGTKYWRVRAFNTLNAPGAWSAYRSIIIDTVAPAAPNLSSPADNAVVNTAAPALSVGAVTGANRYQFQVSTLVNFSNIIVDKTITTTSTTATPALPFGFYFWRVRALDAAGNVSGWSGVRGFTYTLMSAPANESLTTDATPAFTWRAMTGATGWKLLVDDDPFFASPEVNQTINSGGVLTYSPPSALPFGLYFWKMQVNTAAGWSIWMPLWTVTVSTPIPAVPVLTSPANGAQTNTPIFTWTSVAYGENYQIQIATNTSFTAIAYDVILDPGLLAYSAAGLTEGTKYWRVRARNAYGLPGAWSAYRSIIFDMTPPGVPPLSSPGDGAITTDKTPTFSVNAVSGAIQYNFVIATDSGFTNILTNVSIGSTSYTPTTNYPVGLLYWRVAAIDAAGNESGWSAVRILNIN